MARFCFFTQFLILSFSSFSLSSDSSPLEAVPQSDRVAGVFLLIDGGKYTFNFTAARAACLFLNITMATTAQIEQAVQSGLETCKYGWIAEQIAVIPRITANPKCGKGKTGVVMWNANPNVKFGVFCFNSSDLETTRNRSTDSPQSSTFSTTLMALTPTSPPATPLLRSTTKSPPSAERRTMDAPDQTSATSAFTLLFNVTNSTRTPFTSTSPKTFSTRFPTSASHRITSKPFTFSSSAHASDFTVSLESASVRPATLSLGDVPTALIILGIVLLLTAAGMVWYYKLSIFTLWPQGQQKDDMETEMWTHIDSEVDLHRQHEGEEEEADRKYSSDIMLCVNPDIKTNSSE